MKDSSPARTLVRLSLWSLMPSALLVLVIWWVSDPSIEEALVRFVNAMLTSFTLISFMLLVVLFAYGDARKRPLAPLVGMFLLVSISVGLTLFFLSQGDFLMEANASVRAQYLSNIIRFGTTVSAASVSLVVVGGTLLASLLNTPQKVIRFEEE